MPASGRRVRKKKALSRSGGEEQKYRRCEKSGCPAERPECFSNAIERFAGWYTVFALSSLPMPPLLLSYIFSTSTYNNPCIIFSTLCSLQLLFVHPWRLHTTSSHKSYLAVFMVFISPLFDSPLFSFHSVPLCNFQPLPSHFITNPLLFQLPPPPL